MPEKAIESASARRVGLNRMASAFLGALFGATAGYYAPDNILFHAICVVVGGSALYLAEKLLTASWWKGILVFVGVATLAGISYLTVIDPLSANQRMFTTVRVNLRPEPGVHAMDNMAVLDAGEEVICLDRTWRRYRFVREYSSYFAYWRKVKTMDGREGWIYGAYLEAFP